MSKKEPYKFKSLYFDKSTNSNVQIIQIDQVSIQFRNINDEEEKELTQEEVIHLINTGLWVPVSAPIPKVEVKAPISQPVMSNKTLEAPRTETISCYIESIKKLKSGEVVKISTQKQNGWLLAEVMPQSSKVEIDLSRLDGDDIRKIMEILEK